MSPMWGAAQEAQLVESRRIQVELAESAALLMAVSQRLSDLVAELNAESEPEGGSPGGS